MPARRNNIRRDEPASLRTGGTAPAFSDQALLVVAIFAAALCQAGYGFYCKLSADGQSLRVKIYGDDETWADNISCTEDLAMLLDGFAEQLKAGVFFRGLMAEHHRQSAPAATSGPQTADKAPKGLRGQG